ncbi:MAG: hypothetical protein ABI295_12565 [Xanthomarina sp.]
MSKQLLKFTIILLSLTVFTCKNDSVTFNNYKYIDQENILVCELVNTQLYFEALLSFEDDISNRYDPEHKNIRRGYSAFTRDALNKTLNFQDIVSPHTMEIFEVLKNDTDLWHSNNTLNYNSKLLTCIGDNLKNEGLKTTFKALVSTHSMRPDIFGAPLTTQVKNAHQDRYMAAYVAFDLFYANLFDIDPTKVIENKRNLSDATHKSKSKSTPEVFKKIKAQESTNK